MATADERFMMPDGSAYIVRRPAAETGGEFVEMGFVLPPGCVPPPPHVHPRQVEEYEVLEGRLDLVVDADCPAASGAPRALQASSRRHVASEIT